MVRGAEVYCSYEHSTTNSGPLPIVCYFQVARFHLLDVCQLEDILDQSVAINPGQRPRSILVNDNGFPLTPGVV